MGEGGRRKVREGSDERQEEYIKVLEDDAYGILHGSGKEYKSIRLI